MIKVVAKCAWYFGELRDFRKPVIGYFSDSYVLEGEMGREDVPKITAFKEEPCGTYTVVISYRPPPSIPIIGEQNILLTIQGPDKKGAERIVQDLEERLSVKFSDTNETFRELLELVTNKSIGGAISSQNN